MAQNNQQTNNTNTNQPANTNNPPAGSLLRRTANGQNTNQAQNNNTNNNSPFNSRFNRFGNNANNAPERPTWTITPMSMAGVRIELVGLGDPFFRILDTPLDKSIHDIEGILKRLNEGHKLFQQLSEELDRRWEKIGFTGAVMLYPVHKNIQLAFSEPTMPVQPAAQDLIFEDDSDNQASQPAPANSPVAQTTPYRMFRAIDPALIFNILGRVRGNVLVDGTPLALEEGFLKQSYLCDDDRIVELALATGAIEEAW